MARKYTIRSKEEKLAIVKEVLNGKPIRAWEPEISNQLVRVWVKKYQAEGETGLETKKRLGDSLARFKRRKELSYTEQLQYQIVVLSTEKKTLPFGRGKHRICLYTGQARCPPNAFPGGSPDPLRAKSYPFVHNFALAIWRKSWYVVCLPKAAGRRCTT